MTYLIGIALGLWLVVIPAAVLLLLGVDRSRDVAWEDERPEWADDFTAHPAATRIRDLIAANEADRIDAEWEAMNS